MRISALLAFLSATVLVAAIPAADPIAEPLAKPIAGPALDDVMKVDFVVGCCNPKNKFAWKADATRYCCDQVKGAMVYTTNPPACGISAPEYAAYKGCCRYEGNQSGTPDWDACTP
ncbi:hypothetical protein FKW77_002966 [Venturia effusa]|uniref:Uncharacterized protein n=1 Tax=Venturia effusa TaxID=50376 RepID=A0A517LAN0_9PEZI|nr:hypothetical protein FKW77_002966 [Venturia effusa]